MKITMYKILRVLAFAVIVYFIGGIFYWTYIYNKQAHTPQVNNASSTIQQGLDAGANTDTDIERYKKFMADACIEATPQASTQMKEYCKCASSKVIDVYGVNKVADMGLSMTKAQLQQEFEPYVNQCVALHGVDL